MISDAQLKMNKLNRIFSSIVKADEIIVALNVDIERSGSNFMKRPLDDATAIRKFLLENFEDVFADLLVILKDKE